MKQLDKKSVWLFFVGSIGGILFSTIFLVGFGFTMAIGEDALFDFDTIMMWVVIAAIALIIVSYIWAKLTYHFYRYELTDLGFRKESGVIYKKYVTIPYARIQNVDINRGILARILGLSDLMIQTAGTSASVNSYGAWGTGAEGRLPGIDKNEAEELRDELVRRSSRAGQSQGL